MVPIRTKTGNFPIGFRKLRSEWLANAAQISSWTQQNRFAFIELGNDADALASQIVNAGVRVVCADLPNCRGMLSPNARIREQAVAQNSDYILACIRQGIRLFLTVMVPEDPALSPGENYAHMLDAYRQLAPVFMETGTRLVIEGCPNPGVLCCNPESLRAFFSDSDCPAFGFNFDPSHLIRMGIDPLRFLREFAPRIFHFHAKDTAIDTDSLYDFGWTQPSIRTEPKKWGGTYWRYTIPGHGLTPWTKAFKLLQEHGYTGAVSIELEDYEFNGSPDGEQKGLLLSRDFVESV